ncbi:hypothetical protein [Bacillus cereus group sp. BfR-BA-01381]|uniref:hypothetical protein n=1 Tax=Bacillus cereus group sp. BfR-BA-01381 TaxID=2920325 RepID=UPI001F5A98B4|nr:hypothetical protein [Bacillus cereus group sp. BfR-BA-01381]
MTIKGVIFQPENLYKTAIRKPQIRKGVMFNFSQNESQTTEKEVMKPPRTEPLEYAWKKMNI